MSENQKIIEEVKVFRFKDNREVPLPELTDEELIYALKFSDVKLDKVCNTLDSLERKMEQSKALTAKQQKEFDLLSGISSKLTYLHEDLRELGKKRDLIFTNTKEKL